jgi:phosphoserine phosphatase RsbU/P
MKPADARSGAAPAGGALTATSKHRAKTPVGRLLLLAILLSAATAYQVRVAEFHHPEWFGRSQAWPPFTMSGQYISFLDFVSLKAGLKEGDRLLSVNGRPLTAKAVFGEELRKARPGDVMTVTVLRRESGRESKATYTLHLVGRERSNWQGRSMETILLIVLPYLAVLVGFWVAIVRPRDPRAWLVLAITGSYLGISNAGVAEWPPYVRDLAVAFHGAVVYAFPIWLLLFGIYFPEPFPETAKISRWQRMKWFLIIPLALAAILFAVRLVGEMESYASVAFMERVPHILEIALVNIYFVTVGGALGLLAAKHRSAVSSDAKRRLRLLFVGAAISLGTMFLLFAIAITRGANMEQFFPRWLYLPAEFLFFLFPLVLAYVIVVHRAMDVRVVLRQGLQYALAKNGVRVIQGLVTVAVFFAAVTLVADSSRNRVEKIAVIAVGLSAVMAIRRSAERLRGWVDRRFFREAYDAERVLSELSDHVRSIVEPQSLLQTVVTRISETLHVPQIAVLLDSGPFRPAYALGYSGLSELTFPGDSATVRTLRAQREPVRLHLDGAGSWLQREAGRTQPERDCLEQLQAEVLLPLAGRDKLLGFITLGPKRSEEPFTGNDLRLLKSVANQTGLALENAQLLAAITEEVAQRERLNREVEIAREVQERLFPQVLPPVAGLDYSGACRPALGVGGDYYDFLALPEGKFGVAIGDVSGKGIAAALMMASLEASLRAEATRAPDDLAALVGNVNHLVFQASISNRYATFFYAQYQPGQRRLTYVNAGHNPPILLRRQGGGCRIIRLTAGGAVVGLLESFPYQQETLILQPGDVLVAFTDGISEAMNPAEEEFGEERLLEVLKECADLPAASALSAIMQAADSFAAGAKQYDDMTLVVLRVLENIG